MPLTGTSIRNAKPGKRPYRLFDGGGLYLKVSPNDGKWWRFKYRFADKEKRLSLGVYAEVPLAGRKIAVKGKFIYGARDRRDEARQLLAQRIDPSSHRKARKAVTAERAANRFELIALEWYTEKLDSWTPGSDDAICVEATRDYVPGSDPVLESLALQCRNDGIGYCDIMRGIADESVDGCVNLHCTVWVSCWLALSRFGRSPAIPGPPICSCFLQTGCAGPSRPQLTTSYIPLLRIGTMC